MLGMMNQGHGGNDADLFYSARKKSRTAVGDNSTVMDEMRRIFGQRRPNYAGDKIVYLQDGRKCVDGKLVKETKEWTPEKCWAELIIGKRMARKSLRRKMSRIESMKRRQNNGGNEERKMKKKIGIGI